MNGPVPTEVRAPRGSVTTTVSWSDGHVSVHQNATLRGWCPCAGCQGHEGSVRFIEGANSEVADIEEVGNYGLSFSWGDGHASGIYAWAYLRGLCECDACRATSSRPSR